MYYDTYKVL